MTLTDKPSPPPKPKAPESEGLAALRRMVPAPQAAPDPAAGILNALRAAAPAPAPAVPDAASSALDALRKAAPAIPAAPVPAGNALDALRATAAPAAKAPDAAAQALSALRGAAPAASAPQAAPQASALDSLRTAAVPQAPGPAPDAAAQALSAMRGTAPAAMPADHATADPLAALRTAAPPAVSGDDQAGAALAAMRSVAPAPAPPPAADAAAGALAALRSAAPDDVPPAPQGADALASLRAAVPAPAQIGSQEPDPLADLLAQMAGADAPQAGTPAADPLDDLSAFLAAAEEAPTDNAPDELAAFLAMAEADSTPAADDAADDLAAFLAMAEADSTPAPDAETDELAAFLATAASDPAPPPKAAVGDDPLAALEDLLAAPPPVADDPLAGLDDLLNAPPAAPVQDPLAGLDDVLVAATRPAAAAPETAMAPAPSSFGVLTAPDPAPGTLDRKVFRIAVLGDFSGRAARGEMQTGAALAGRRAIKLDVDTVEEVIEGFATTLVLPVGPQGQGIAVPLAGLDSLHPDELVGNVAIFDELKGLRQRLSSPSMAARAVAEMQGWGAVFDAPAAPTSARSAAQAVPTDLRLTDFQRLVGGARAQAPRPSPAADMIGRIVGPYVVPGPNPEARVLRGAVDSAMSAAMRLVLHHPEFQAIEAQWRMIDFLARRIETDETLEVMLYDVSAEELAADLAAVEDLGKSGLYSLLAAPLHEEGGVGFSAICGLYTFEETPPHAALLGRIATIAGAVQAPFFAALSPAYLDTPKKDRHRLIARAWDDLRADPAAAWLGLASPRFLLRRPYGARSEPIDAFDFEEFTMSEGLSGMLWANPVVMIAVLLADAWTADGRKMVLGKQMSLGEMPYHFVTDRHGDQVALPATERNMTTGKVEETVTRGLMPVIGIKGRDVVRLGSFQSVAGREIAGPWGSEAPPPPRAAAPYTPSRAARAPDLQASVPAGPSPDDELDALLASFGEPSTPADPSAIDADLAALLEGL